MTKDDLANLLAQLRPSESLSVSYELFGAFPSRSALCYVLDRKARTHAEKFGASHNCDFEFDQFEGIGVFVKRAAS